MDLMLTQNGDILLEEVFTESHEVGFNFFIKPNSHAVCFKFDIEQDFIPHKHNGISIGFDIRKKQELFDAIVLDEAGLLKQMCYNAIRTQKNSLRQEASYGSTIYQEKNKRITNEMLERLAYLAKEAIKDFAPDAIVSAQAKNNLSGACNIIFEIHTLAHTLKLDYLI